MYYVISDRLGFRISIYFSKRHKLGKEHEIPHLHTVFFSSHVSDLEATHFLEFLEL